MPRKQKRVPKTSRKTHETEQYYLAVLARKDPQRGAAMIFPSEECVSYPWTKDRCNEQWAIVPKERVIRGSAEFTTRNGLNTFVLCLLRVAWTRIETMGNDTKLVAHLGDLDSKWIAANDLEGITVFTCDDGSDLLKILKEFEECPEWLTRMRALFEASDHSEAKPDGKLVVSVQSGNLSLK